MIILYSNQIVLAQELIKGYIEIENGVITNIVRNQTPKDPYVDLTGKFILPGLVNISATNYFDEINSRASRFFSDDKILLQSDRLFFESGITTCYHAFHLEDLLNRQSVEDAILQLQNIKEFARRNAKVDHRIHVIFRLGDSLANRNLRELINGNVVDFITCTGYYNPEVFNYQNQYFIQNLQNRFDLSDQQANDIMDKLIDQREESALDELSYRIRSAKSRNIPFASNRYRLIKRLQDQYRIRTDLISGLHTPQTNDNIHKDKIHYAISIEDINEAADIEELLDLLTNNTIDLLYASNRSNDIVDYIFNLEGTLGLPQAVNLFSKNPAEALGLGGLVGEIKVGGIGNITVVHMVNNLPTVDSVYSKGEKIIQYSIR